MSNFGPSSSSTVNLVPIQGVLDTNGNVTAVVSPNGTLVPMSPNNASLSRNVAGTIVGINGDAGAVLPLSANTASVSRSVSGLIVGIAGDNGAVLPLGPLGGPSTIAVLGNSLVALAVNQNATASATWNIATAVSLNAVFQPASSVYPDGTVKGFVYTCIQAGTTAATWDLEPIWPTTPGVTIVDNSVTWRCDTAVGDMGTMGGALADWWHLSQYLGGNPFRPVFVGGLGGKKCADINAKLPYVMALNPAYIYMGNWLENDTWLGSAPTVGNINAAWLIYKAALDKVISAGIVPIVTTLFPSGNIDTSGTAFTAYVSGLGTKSWYWLNGKIKEYVAANRTKIIFIDGSTLWTDPSIATSTNAPIWPENATTFLTAGTGQFLKRTDSIHPYFATSYLYAKAFAAAVAAFRGVQPTFAGGSGDAFNPVPNPLNQGTAGTKGANAGVITGTVPTSFGLDCYGTTVTSVTTSQIDRAAAGEGVVGNWFRVVYAASVADTVSYSWTQSLSTMGLFVGDTVEISQEIRILANPVLFVAPELWVRFVGGTGPQWFKLAQLPTSAQDLGQFITVDTIFQLRTEPLQIPVGCTSIACYARGVARNNAASSFTIDFGRQRVGKFPYLSVFA